jgi:hypothetical protein
MPFTLINVFRIGGSDAIECWTAHYATQEVAKEALRALLEKRREMPDEDFDKTFESLISTGMAYHAFCGSDEDWYFVRVESVHGEFDKSQLPGT